MPEDFRPRVFKFHCHKVRIFALLDAAKCLIAGRGIKPARVKHIGGIRRMFNLGPLLCKGAWSSKGAGIVVEGNRRNSAQEAPTNIPALL